MITESLIWSKWICNCHDFHRCFLTADCMLAIKVWPFVLVPTLDQDAPQVPAVAPSLLCNLTASVAQAMYQALATDPSPSTLMLPCSPSPVLPAFVFLTFQDWTLAILSTMSLLLNLTPIKRVIWVGTDEALSQKASWNLSLNWESEMALWRVPSLLWPLLLFLWLLGYLSCIPWRAPGHI